MTIPVIKSIIVMLAAILPLILIVAAIIRSSFHDTMRDLGFSDKECAGWSDFPII